jgi:hypothetical protein
MKFVQKDFAMSSKISLQPIAFLENLKQDNQMNNHQSALPQFTKNAAGLLVQLVAVALLMICLKTTVSAQSCKALFPAGNGQDDSVIINDCLQRKGVAKLKAGTFLLYSPIIFPRTSQEAPISGARLVGKGKELTKLVVQSECTKLWPVTSDRQYEWAIQIVKSPEASLVGLELDLTNLRQSCGPFGNYMVFVNKSPGTQVSDVRIKGSQFSATSTTYTTGGANSGGILVVNSETSIISNNELKDIGFTLENGGTSAGNGGISVANSANTQITNNLIERVAFGVIVSNGSPQQGYTGDSSGTVVANNRIIGASSINCLNCSQGRAIKLQACGNGDERPLEKLRIERNEASDFGGNLGVQAGSGLDLVCGIQNSTFESNRFIGAATAEFALQIRSSFLSEPNPTHHNTFHFNQFISGRGRLGCNDQCADVNFTSDGPDQIGIRRSGLNRAGDNAASSFRYATDRGCDEHSYAFFLYPDDGREFVRHNESILLTAIGVRPNSQVTFRFTRTEDGLEVATHKSLSVNRNCIMNQEYIPIDALKFPAGNYKIFAEYKDGNSDAIIEKDEIGIIKVKPSKGN